MKKLIPTLKDFNLKLNTDKSVAMRCKIQEVRTRDGCVSGMRMTDDGKLIGFSGVIAPLRSKAKTISKIARANPKKANRTHQLSLVASLSSS